VIEPVLAEAESKMDKSVETMQRELTTIRTGRANPALIDRVMVPYYGTPTPLNQLAQISAPEARMLLVNVYDRSQVGAVEKALRAPELGLNPASDGNVVRVPIPPLTEERRRDYVKMVRQKAEERASPSATSAATRSTGSSGCKRTARCPRTRGSARWSGCRRSPTPTSAVSSTSPEQKKPR